MDIEITKTANGYTVKNVSKRRFSRTSEFLASKASMLNSHGCITLGQLVEFKVHAHEHNLIATVIIL